jgi:hypothetical protein
MAEGNYLALIHDVSELVARGAPAEAVIEAARQDLLELLNLQGCRYEARPHSLGRPQLLRTGEVELADERFDVQQDGLPAGETELVVQSQDHEFGHFVLVAGGGGAVSIEQRVVAIVLADQVGATLAGASHPT